MEIKDLYKIFLKCGDLSTDSRSISGGELFFAIRGENFDGNAFAEAALEKGAAYAVVTAGARDWDASPLRDRLIPVEDTMKAIQALARQYRESLPAASDVFPDRLGIGSRLPVIGLTGTNGKTTTKELVFRVLAAKYRVSATDGNLNNSLGVPLTVLSISPRMEIAVVEMGASHPGDIRELVEVAAPDFGLITNVGKAHLLGFGSFEGVKATKGELYDFLAENGGTALVNTDNPHLVEMAAARHAMKTVPYGKTLCGAEILPSSAEHPYLRMKIGERTIETRLVGAYNADNVLAALAVGELFGVPFEDAVSAIEAYEPANRRSQMQKTGRNVLVLDAYNANPSSMEAALGNFLQMEAERKAVMLGDMLELGDDSVEEHVKVLRRAAAIPGCRVFLVGVEFRKALEAVCGSSGRACSGFSDIVETRPGDILSFPTSSALADWLKDNPLDAFTVLVKGSRGIRMENVIPSL